MQFESVYPIGDFYAAQTIVNKLNAGTSAIKFIVEFRGADESYVKLYAATYDLLLAGLADVRALAK